MCTVPISGAFRGQWLSYWIEFTDDCELSVMWVSYTEPEFFSLAVSAPTGQSISPAPDSILSRGGHTEHVFLFQKLT